MVEFVKVCKVSDVPSNGMKGFDVKGKKLLLSNLGGKFYAIDSVCTHVGGPLEKGSMSAEVVTCPWHGSQFDVKSGKVVHGPAQKSLNAYEVKLEENDILVKV